MDYEMKTQEFLAWLPGIGIRISSGVKIQDFRPIRGRGLVAQRDFKEDEILLSIPRSALLNISTAGRFLDPSVKESIQSMPEWLSLSALLLAEANCANSKWGPYLSILPDKLDSLIFWSPEELKELQASAVIHKIGKAASEEIITKFMPSIGLNNYCLQSCHLAASIIMAYAFDIPENITESEKKIADEEDYYVSDNDEETTLSLVPLADLLNADVDKNNARLCCDNEELEMRTIKYISAGEEIFNDYGSLPQSDLLRRYGYVADSYAKYNVVEISAESALSIFRRPEPIKLLNGKILEPLNSQEFEKRITIAMREDIFEDAYDISHSGPEGPGIPDELIALIYIFLLDNTNFNAIEASQVNIPGRSKLSTQLVGQALAKILKERENEYATSLEVDEDLLRTSKMSARQLMAVKVRLGEKVILRESIQEALSYSVSNKKMRANVSGVNDRQFLMD
ncbi:hypothetical protein K3495_g2916 [Podosphaera aphanis]|nr:hypothetical protein K3495_g2916 [Podosphaera aphanis]